MTHPASFYRNFDRVLGFYMSRQFALYIACGVVATIAHLSARYALNFYVSFSTAVLLSYFFGMLVALLLYRSFVFDTRAGALPRQALLFMAAYLAFLPVTWGLSVATEGPLLGFLPTDAAHFVAHVIGVGVPVMLNFAFNKLVTFRDVPATRRRTSWSPGTQGSPDVGSPSARRRMAAGALLALVCVYAVSVAVVGTSGNFPLNDDWAYANTTREFVGTGVFTPSSWSSIPLLTEVLFAWPVCVATACGSDDLRVATLLASLILFSATFLLVRTGSHTIAAPILAAVAVAFNPVAYTLAFTFMSDMLFAALMTVGAILFIRSLERESVPLAVLGTATALAATLTRQLGLCLPLAYLAVSLVQMIGGGTWRRRAIPALLPLAVCAAALVILKRWLSMAGRLPALYDIKSNILVETLHSPLASLMRVGHNLSIIITYMGLFTLPLLLVTRAHGSSPPRGTWLGRLPRLAAGAGTALAVIDLASLHRLMPSGGNILAPQGVGPLLLRDTAILGASGIPPLPQAFWLVVTLLSLLGGFLLVERVTDRVLGTLADLGAPHRRWIPHQGSRENKCFSSERCALSERPVDRSTYFRGDPQRQVSVLFAATAAVAYVAPLLLIPFYDRYLIPLLPLAFLLVTNGAPTVALRHWRAGFAMALCCLVSVYAVLSVHDYMTWNRARWRAIADLEASQGIGAGSIDGGMEYNGLHAYRADYQVQAGKSWWWIDRDDYQITFEAIDGLETIMRYPYETLLPPAERSIKVLRKPK